MNKDDSIISKRIMLELEIAKLAKKQYAANLECYRFIDKYCKQENELLIQENELSDYDKELIKRRAEKVFSSTDMEHFAYYARNKIGKITLDVLLEDWQELNKLRHE